jgi:hypothetical protein
MANGSHKKKDSMKNDTNNCPECGAKIDWEYEAPYQEYPGARVWGGEYYAECDCGWHASRRDLKDYNIREW